MDRRVLLAACLFAVALAARTARAQIVVGPGFDVPNEELDTPATGGRINVDQGAPAILEPGTYRVNSFAFDAGQAGDVTPFLARPASGTTDPSDVIDQYVAILVGDTVNVAGAAANQVVPFGGSNTFTLAARTLVFVGISSTGNNPVFFDNGTGPATDHEGTGAASYAVTVGGTVPPDGSFSNPNLGRTYSILLNIDVVPEPGAAAFLGLGGVALLARRRRA